MDEQRLIDANALIEKCKEIIDDEYNSKVAPESWTDAYRYFIDDIDETPTVEAKPVVHAHWTGSNGTYCSHCEKSYMDVADADSWESSDIPDFCPYCGAQMDEKEG